MILSVNISTTNQVVDDLVLKAGFDHPELIWEALPVSGTKPQNPNLSGMSRVQFYEQVDKYLSELRETQERLLLIVAALSQWLESCGRPKLENLKPSDMSDKEALKVHLDYFRLVVMVERQIMSCKGTAINAYNARLEATRVLAKVYLEEADLVKELIRLGFTFEKSKPERSSWWLFLKW